MSLQFQVFTLRSRVLPNYGRDSYFATTVQNQCDEMANSEQEWKHATELYHNMIELFKIT